MVRVSPQTHVSHVCQCVSTGGKCRPHAQTHRPPTGHCDCERPFGMVTTNQTSQLCKTGNQFHFCHDVLVRSSFHPFCADDALDTFECNPAPQAARSIALRFCNTSAGSYPTKYSKPLPDSRLQWEPTAKLCRMLSWQDNILIMLRYLRCHPLSWLPSTPGSGDNRRGQPNHPIWLVVAIDQVVLPSLDPIPDCHLVV